jgi:hypothetical protein
LRLPLKQETCDKISKIAKTWAIFLITPFHVGFKEKNSICGISKGARTSDEKSDAIMEIENHHWPVGIRNPENAYSGL